MTTSAKTAQQVEQQANSLKEANRPYVMATVVRTEDATSAKAGAKAVIDDAGNITGWIGGGCAQPAVCKAALQAISDGRPRLIRVRPGTPDNQTAGIEEYEAHCHSGGTLDIFIEPVLAKPSLLVMGASPVGQMLARLAQEVGYNVSVACRKEDVSLFQDIDRVVTGFDVEQPAAESAQFVVVATQGRGDRAALEAALASTAPHISLVASHRKAAKLKSDLVEDGFDAARVRSIRAPAGLDIAATTPEEIAVSILAEMIQRRHAELPPAIDADMEADEAVVSVEVVARADCGNPRAR